MAEGGSDFVFDFYCGPCKSGDRDSEGTSYCPICREYLCDVCSNVHKNSRATRTHAVSVLQQDGRNEVPTLDFELCAKHLGKRFEWYCPAHDDVLCSECRVTIHRRCKKVNRVEDVSTGVKEGLEAAELTAKFISVNNKMRDLCNERKDDQTTLRQKYNQCLQSISLARMELNERLDELEKELKKEMDERVAKEEKIIQEDISCLKTLNKTLERNYSSFSLAKDRGSENQMFIAIKKIDIHEVLRALADIEQEHYMVTVDFQPNESLENLQSFGKLAIRSFAYPPNAPLSSLREKTFSKVTERIIQESDDREPCRITGGTIKHSGECLLCDCANQKIKLLDPDYTLQASVRLRSDPWDIAMVTDHKAVISLPSAEKVQFLTLPDLKLGRSVRIGKTCCGVAASQDQIFVTCDNSPGEGEVLVLSLTGDVQRRVGRKEDGTFLFNHPSYVGVDPCGEWLYVCDWNQNSVTCLSRHGDTVYTYTDRDLQGPNKLLVDSKGTVYVCAGDSSRSVVQVVTPKGKKHRTLLTWSGGNWEPQALCYRARDDTMVVGMNGNHALLVYRFSCETVATRVSSPGLGRRQHGARYTSK